MTDRQTKIRAGLNLPSLTGLEIGPLDKPLIERTEGPIIYIDHLDSEGLRRKYVSEASIDTARIVDVDAVWGNQTLAEALGERAPVDYVVASHVIEHVPDLLGWLDELYQVIKPGGDLRLVVPDRRFTFDFLRRETNLADILNAYLQRARKPRPISILDFALNVAAVDTSAAWKGEIDPATLRKMYTPEGALSIARDTLENDAYHDVHCWVFTPSSFIDLFRSAGALGLIRFACKELHDTEPYQFEFFAALTPCDNIAEIEASWRTAAQLIGEARCRGSFGSFTHPMSPYNLREAVFALTYPEAGVFVHLARFLILIEHYWVWMRVHCRQGGLKAVVDRARRRLRLMFRSARSA